MTAKSFYDKHKTKVTSLTRLECIDLMSKFSEHSRYKPIKLTKHQAERIIQLRESEDWIFEYVAYKFSDEFSLNVIGTAYSGRELYNAAIKVIDHDRP